MRPHQRRRSQPFGNGVGRGTLVPQCQPDFMNALIHKTMRPAIVEVITLLVAVSRAAQQGEPDLAAFEIEAVEAVVGDVEE